MYPFISAAQTCLRLCKLSYVCFSSFLLWVTQWRYAYFVAFLTDTSLRFFERKNTLLCACSKQSNQKKKKNKERLAGFTSHKATKRSSAVGNALLLFRSARLRTADVERRMRSCGSTSMSCVIVLWFHNPSKIFFLTLVHLLFLRPLKKSNRSTLTYVLLLRLFSAPSQHF